MFDLYYFILNRTSEQGPAELPGLLVLPPAKPGGRGREADLVILSLTFNGPSPYLPQAHKDLLQKIAATYLKSSGSITAGLRLAADQLNSILLERNLRQAKDGSQAFGLMHMAVVREDMLYMAQAGPSHSLVLSTIDVQDNFDSAGKGMGASSTSNLRFYQSTLQVGDVLLLTANPPAAWNAGTLAGSPQMTLEHLRRRLLSQGEPESLALVFKFQAGKGQLHPLRLRSTSLPSSEPTKTPVENEPQLAVEASTSLPPAAQVETRPQTSTFTPRVVPVIEEPPVPPATPKTSQAERKAQAEAAAERLVARRLEADRRRQKMAGAWLGWKATRERWANSFKNFFTRLLPGRASQPVGFSQGWMLFTAIAIPLLVVAVATTVYFQTGRTEQRQVYFQQAAAYITQAMSQSDPVLQRNDWLQALQWLEKTEAYGATDETRTLRRRAQQGLDSLDKIVRLDYLPVNNYGFAASVKITRILANTANDLFVLDGNSGRVSRLALGAQGYDLDNTFNCGPGQSAALNIGPLVDIDLMPLGNPFRASVIGVDNRGTVVFCLQGGKAPITAQLTPPSNGWGNPSRIRFSQYTLSILDVKSNTVWRYAANRDMLFGEGPRSFFKGNQTLLLNDVVDMTLYNDDLFMLRENGSVVKCFDNRASETLVRCTDPMKFEDRRAGREVSPMRLEDTAFKQIIAVEMPNPSLYILDGSAPAIYQFSLALYLNEQYRAQSGGESPSKKEPPTAFTISANRQAFIAYGNQVYYAQIR